MTVGRLTPSGCLSRSRGRGRCGRTSSRRGGRWCRWGVHGELGAGDHGHLSPVVHLAGVIAHDDRTAHGPGHRLGGCHGTWGVGTVIDNSLDKSPVGVASPDPTV